MIQWMRTLLTITGNLLLVFLGVIPCKSDITNNNSNLQVQPLMTNMLTLTVIIIKVVLLRLLPQGYP